MQVGVLLQSLSSIFSLRLTHVAPLALLAAQLACASTPPPPPPPDSSDRHAATSGSHDDGHDAHSPPSDTDTLVKIQSLNSEVSRLWEQRRIPDALQRARQSAQLTENLLGDTHEATVLSFHNLATLLLVSGQLPEATYTAERAAKASESVHGPDSLQTAVSLELWAECLIALGDKRQAKNLTRRAQQIRQQGGDDGDDARVRSLEQIAQALSAAGDHPQAARTLEEALNLLKAKGEDKSLRAAPLHLQHAHALHHARRYDEAAKAAQRAIDIRSQQLGPQELPTAEAQVQRAIIWHAQGELDRAIRLMHTAYDTYKLRHGVRDRRLLTPLEHLAQWSYEQDELRRARNHLTEALAIHDHHPSTPPEALSQTLHSLSTILIDLKDYPAAKEILQRAIRLGQAHPQVNRDHLEVAAFNLARTNWLLGRRHEAKDQLEKLIKDRRQARQLQTPRGAMFLNTLGILSDEIGDTPRALTCFEEALQIRRRLFGESHPDTAATLNNLTILRNR